MPQPIIQHYQDGTPSVLRKATVYTELHFYRKSDVLVQLTKVFCERFLPKYSDRTVDQMVQAARSIKQNIAEGCTDGQTSVEVEIKLLGIAKGSNQELLEDYQDYLKQHGLPEWAQSAKAGGGGGTGGTGETGCTGGAGKPGSPGGTGMPGDPGDPGMPGGNGGSGMSGCTGRTGGNGMSGDPGKPGSPGGTGETGRSGGSGMSGNGMARNAERYNRLRAFCKEHSDLDAYRPYLHKWTDEEMCNTAICLCHMVDKAMCSFIERKDREFVEQGGIRERMTAARLDMRGTQKQIIAQQEQEIAALQAEIASLRRELAALKGK